MSFKASTAEIPTRVRAEAIDPLALAVVACSSTPLLLLDGDLELIAASTSFCSAFEIEPGEVTRRSLPDLGRGEWGAPQLGSLLRATASGYGEVDSCELDLEPAGREPRHLVVKAQRLDCGAAGSVRLVLSVTDVTDARLAQQLKDDLLRDNAMLLQELQHRVANGLQIIAGVLMQSARRVQSAETRGHLHDAHHRIMSVAALQRQLAGSKLDTVEMRPYLEELCASIAGSMVHDHDQLSLSVTVDEVSTEADAAVSIGLIVTELVINALKHAFPGHRRGAIKVDYRSAGRAWSLSVHDDGVGIPADQGGVKAGLGTGILGALADKLGATVQVAPAHPGTTVSIFRTARITA